MKRTLHIGIIMDGNGRWAERRGMPRLVGHQAGVKAVRRIVQCAPEMGVRMLTVYAFSSDNWMRPVLEVQSLMRLLGTFLSRETLKCLKQGVRVQFVGRRDRLPRDLVEAMELTEEKTRNCTSLHLRIAVDYSSRDALVEAAWKMSLEKQFDRDGMARALGAEDMDLVIRTASEKRLSDFFLWEAAYAEFWFTETLWPDFDRKDLAEALADYEQRTRKFGGLAKLAS